MAVLECSGTKMLGADTIVSVAFKTDDGSAVCAGTDPSTLTFNPILSVTSKSVEDSIQTTGTRTDSDTGAYAPTIVTGVEGTVTVDGVIDPTDDNTLDFELQVYENSQANKGLYCFVQVLNKRTTETVFALVTGFTPLTGDAESEATYSITFTKQSSTFNSKIRTPAN